MASVLPLLGIDPWICSSVHESLLFSHWATRLAFATFSSADWVLLSIGYGQRHVFYVGQYPESAHRLMMDLDRCFSSHVFVVLPQWMVYSVLKALVLQELVTLFVLVLEPLGCPL